MYGLAQGIQQQPAAVDHAAYQHDLKRPILKTELTADAESQAGQLMPGPADDLHRHRVARFGNLKDQRCGLRSDIIIPLAETFQQIRLGAGAGQIDKRLGERGLRTAPSPGLGHRLLSVLH